MVLTLPEFPPQRCRMPSGPRASPLRYMALCLEATIAPKERSYLELVDGMAVEHHLNRMRASWDALLPVSQLVRHSASICNSVMETAAGGSQLCEAKESRRGGEEPTDAHLDDSKIWIEVEDGDVFHSRAEYCSIRSCRSRACR